MSIYDWEETWLRGKQAEGLAATTLTKYRSDLKALGLDISQSTLIEIRCRLASCSEHYSRAVLRHIVIITKQVLRELGRREDADSLKLPKRAEPRIVIYSPAEIMVLLHACENLRDRLLIEILNETGARRGELYAMRLKDVQFDQYSAIVWLRGKTGTRTRRVYSCLVDINRYLEQHPQRQDPEAKFWLNKYGRPLAYQGIYKSVHRIGRRALNRDVYPHGFRHTAATRDVKAYTDREMMIRYGWTRPDMVTVYAHLTARDVDDKDLALHGLLSSRRI